MSVTNPNGSALKGKRVVIYEDEALTIMHLARTFEKAGMEVVGSAVNGSKPSTLCAA